MSRFNDPEAPTWQLDPQWGQTVSPNGAWPLAAMTARQWGQKVGMNARAEKTGRCFRSQPYHDHDRDEIARPLSDLMRRRILHRGSNEK
ncbi:MAG: hypothetical protein HYS13_16890 [Planctomycetia bacterium]|nr:hypothetical protein [Planctomycetia bacterium]